MAFYLQLLFPNALYVVFLLCLLIQLGYAFYYFIPFIFYKPATTNAKLYPVSVIIAAHNELPNLKRLLPAVLAQSYPEFEIIVVDDRSTDSSTDYLEDIQRQFAGFRYIKIKDTANTENSKKHALIQGVAVARYEHLLLTDADCKPLSSNWIHEIIKGFNHQVAVVLGYSPYITKRGFINHLIRYETLLSAIQYLSFSVKGHGYMGVGRNLAYTKTCFYQNNGFNSHLNTLGGDDDLFVQEAAQQHQINIVITQESQTASIPKNTYNEWFTQKRRHLNVGRYYKLKDKLRIGIFMFSNIFFYLSGIFLSFVLENLFALSIIYIIRGIVIYLVYILIARKLKEPISVILLPVLDLVYIFNYLVLGVSVLIFNKVKWK